MKASRRPGRLIWQLHRLATLSGTRRWPLFRSTGSTCPGRALNPRAPHRPRDQRSRWQSCHRFPVSAGNPSPIRVPLTWACDPATMSSPMTAECRALPGMTVFSHHDSAGTDADPAVLGSGHGGVASLGAPGSLHAWSDGITEWLSCRPGRAQASSAAAWAYQCSAVRWNSQARSLSEKPEKMAS
jgi:hypothetical protein